MTNSGTSTESRRSGGATGIQFWHFYLLLSMAGAIAAVIVTRHTHPAALLLISAAVVAAGFAATALHYALTGFFGGRTAPDAATLSARTRDAIAREKTLVLRALKELEFDHAMRKVSDADFAEIGSRLRARAMDLIESLDQAERVLAEPAVGFKVGPPASATSPAPAGNIPVFAQLTEPVFAESTESVPPRDACASCGTANDADARFCKSCGARLA